LFRSLEGKAWERFGATGWGKNGTQPVFFENTSYHKCNARDNMKKHYTEKLEKLVEERYEIDYRIISLLNKDRNVIDWNKYNGI